MTKHKVQFEYTMHCLSEILYEYMATAEGLSEWFADEAVERGDDFLFQLEWWSRRKSDINQI